MRRRARQRPRLTPGSPAAALRGHGRTRPRTRPRRTRRGRRRRRPGPPPAAGLDPAPPPRPPPAVPTSAPRGARSGHPRTSPPTTVLRGPPAGARLRPMIRMVLSFRDGVCALLRRPSGAIILTAGPFPNEYGQPGASLLPAAGANGFEEFTELIESGNA